MKRLIGGLDTQNRNYRLYEEDGKLVDHEGKECSLLELHDLLLLAARDSEFGLSRYLIHKENVSTWFCEYVIEYRNNVELFIIAYGNAPEEALFNCIELVKQGQF